MFQKKSRVLFSPKFLTCSVISYHITPRCIKNKKGGGARTAHTDHTPSPNTHPSVLRSGPFVLPAGLVSLGKACSCLSEDAASPPRGFLIPARKSFQELGDYSNFPAAVSPGFRHSPGPEHEGRRDK